MMGRTLAAVLIGSLLPVSPDEVVPALPTCVRIVEVSINDQ